MQTGSAASAAGPKSPVNTALIPVEIVEIDSDTRWRPKPYEEYELAFTLLSVGLVLFAITAPLSILFS